MINRGVVKIMKEKNCYVVTGASTGIGRAICLELSNPSSEFAIVGRNISELNKTKEMIENKGGQARVFIADLTKDSEKVALEILTVYKSIYAIFNVAGVWHGTNNVYYGPMLWETPTTEIESVLSVGIVAPVVFTKTLLPAMIQNNCGKVIQISGTFENGASGWLHYYIGKKAIESFTVGLSEELRKHKIQVNTISPSDTQTEAYLKFFPDVDSSFCNSPEDIAKLASFLASPAADSITGQCIVIRNKNA